MFVFCSLQILYALLAISLGSAEQTDNPIGELVHRTLVHTARGCMTHVNATENDLEYLRRDDPPYPEKTACIIKCLCEKIGVVKKDKFSKNGFLAAVSPLVFTHKKKLEHMRQVSENCDKEINSHSLQPCQIGNELTTCLYKYAPELHFKSKD